MRKATLSATGKPTQTFFVNFICMFSLIIKWLVKESHPQCHRALPAPPAASAWTSCSHNASQRRSACRWRLSLRWWSPRHQWQSVKLNSVLAEVNKMLLKSDRQEATHVCGHQLLFVVNAGHTDLPLTYHGEVIWVCCYEKHFCREKQIKLLENSLKISDNAT